MKLSISAILTFLIYINLFVMNLQINLTRWDAGKKGQFWEVLVKALKKKWKLLIRTIKMLQNINQQYHLN